MILTSASIALLLGVCPLAAEAEQMAKWHPTFSVGWADGYCRYTTENNSPGYSTQLACCKSAYAGQVSGYCLSTLPAPPTTSPTTTGNLLEVWYPDYETGWTEAGCMNNGPLPSGRPIYESQLQCCKGAYAGQVSGRCLSQLPSPPTTSPTKTGGADFYYPDYSTDWVSAGCKNDLPLPFTAGGRPTYASMLACCKGAYANQMSGACLSQLEAPPTTSPTSTGGLDVYYPDYGSPWDKAACTNTRPMPNGRPTYVSMVACCKSAYAGQMSGACLNQLESPPTTSPTLSGGVVDFWYPDYNSPWANAGCLNTLPLPYLPGGRPTYTTNEACCSAAYGGQGSKACLCSMASPPAGCWSRLMSSPATKTSESTLTLNGVNSLPSSDSDMQAIMSRIEAIVNGGLSDGAKVLSISNVSFENGIISYKVEIGYDSSKTSEGSIDAIVGSAAESSPTATPTSGPTTGSPTVTMRPTLPPTTSPTHVPTNSPTNGPSSSPSNAPTGSGPCLNGQACCTGKTTCSDTGCDNLKTGTSPSDVPCGSCNGGSACFGVDPAVLSENSCNGAAACYVTNFGKIGKGSCVGSWTCSGQTAQNWDSPNTACDTVGDPTLIPRPSVVGDNSCNGNQACSDIAGGSGFLTIGNNSCNYANPNYDSAACYGFGGGSYCHPSVIGDGSCNAATACRSNTGGVLGPYSLGDNVCNTANSCDNQQTNWPN